jgi:Sec-independent protein secretion pathway component TatC
MIYTAPQEFFFTEMKLALFGATLRVMRTSR